MQFNSLAFLVFIVAVLPVYFGLGRLGRLRAQNGLLLVASYFFYGWWDWRFLALLATSTIVDYCVGLLLANPSAAQRRRKLYLLASLVVNLGLLGVFKYYDFFVTSAAEALGGLGLQANLPLLNVILPVGISFYTFQTIAYTYSVYRRETPATRDLVAFAVYVAYFPQLVAGPIERARKLLPQIQQPRSITWEKVRSGCVLVLQGLFKKIAIADAVAGYVDVVFDAPATCSSGTLLMGIYMFALQIYGDFSGYTDIARGVSRVLGIELILNFRQPYLATNITDFWRRWHISLSTWLREHLYIPLGGNRHGRYKMYRNLMLTMLLGGLWHGAGWNFVIWGGLHGLYLAVHKYWTSTRATPTPATSSGPRSKVRSLLGVLLTFHLVCLAWIFFRASDFDTAWQVIDGIGAMRADLVEPIPLTALLLLVLTLWIDHLCVSRDRQTPLDSGTPLFVRALAYGSAVVMMILANTSGDVPFIYFQF